MSWKIAIGILLLSGPQWAYYEGGFRAPNAPAGTVVAEMECQVVLDDYKQAELENYRQTHKSLEQSMSSDLRGIVMRYGENITYCRVTFQKPAQKLQKRSR